MTTKIEIIKAEAWVDTMPIQPTPGGTLHVTADINGNGRRAQLVKKVPQGINPEILMLEIKLSMTDEYVENPQHLSYAEQLQKSDQYKSIEIYFEDMKLKTISDIPIVK
jgi:hypothetical protein